MRPLRLPYRGPVSSNEITELTEALHLRLTPATEPALPPSVDTDPPNIDWEMMILLDRIRKGGVYRA